VEETDDEDSDGGDEEGDGMVLDEQNEHQAQDGFDQSDIDEATHGLELFDEESEADTEMAVSFQIFANLLELNICVMLFIVFYWIYTHLNDSVVLAIKWEH